MRKYSKWFGIYCFGYEMYLPKDSVSFRYDFGLAKGSFLIEDNAIPVVGIVDKNFEQVLPMDFATSMPKISFHPNHNAIILIEDPSNLDEPIEVIHAFKEDGEYKYLPLGCEDFISVSANTVVLVFGEGNDKNFVLYDVGQKQIITPYINALSQFYFDEQIGEEVAEAVITLPYEDLTHNNFAHFLINTKGEVKSPIKDIDSGKTYEGDDLVNTIHLIYEDMRTKKVERSRVKLDNEANK